MIAGLALYWRAIYPGSAALLRRSWLAAIRCREERDTPTTAARVHTSTP